MGENIGNFFFESAHVLHLHFFYHVGITAHRLSLYGLLVRAKRSLPPASQQKDDLGSVEITLPPFYFVRTSNFSSLADSAHTQVCEYTKL